MIGMYGLTFVTIDDDVVLDWNIVTHIHNTLLLKLLITIQQIS